MTDLSNHFPLGDPEGVVEGDFVLKAWQPRNEDAKHVVYIQAFDKDLVLRNQVEVRLFHDNRWGIDIEDMENIEEATDKLLNDLKS